MKIDPEELFMAYSWQKIKSAGTPRLKKEFEYERRRDGSKIKWIIIGIILFIFLALIWR
jgi:hypothetical protein